LKLRKQQRRLARRIAVWDQLKNQAPSNNPNDKEGVSAKRHWCRKPGSNNK